MWIVLSLSTKLNILKHFNLFFSIEIHFWEIEHTTQMNDQKDNKKLGKNVFDGNNQERK